LVFLHFQRVVAAKMCNDVGMVKRSSKRDFAQNALRVVEEAIEEPLGKNPHAVALGRMGGKVGGKRRAAKLTPERRKQIATDAAKKRWAADKD
jgi:hypothetical protein